MKLAGQFGWCVARASVLFAIAAAGRCAEAEGARNAADHTAIGAATPLATHPLLPIVIGLAVLVVIACVWGWILRRKIDNQSRTLTEKAEFEARAERHNMQLEAKRSRILEDINSSRPLHELIDSITEMVAFSLGFPFCWCEMPDGARLGNAPTKSRGLRSIRLDIPARAGGALGTLFAATEAGEPQPQDEAPAMEAGVRLATLAIETRRLYKDLVYRSEFDLLTDIHNRQSLDRCLNELIEKSKVEPCIFGIVYIDLDEFKQLNDFYGHHIGDLYLQEVSMRMKRQLRSGDILARLGGDEFAALAPIVRSRWNAALTRPSRWKAMCCGEGQALGPPCSPMTEPQPTVCSAPPTPRCTLRSIPSGIALKCRTAFTKRSSIPKRKSNKSAPIQKEPTRFPPCNP